MFAEYGIAPEDLYEETVLRLLPSYLRRVHNSREQLAILVVNNLSIAFGGKKKKAKPSKGTSSAPTEPRIRRLSPAQLQASLKARSVQE
jgi:hypothetical protein